MNKFSDFNINTQKQSFKGDKIKTDRLLNREITVHDYKITDSKQEPGTQCLHIQISINNNYHVVFTGSKGLMEMIEQVPKDKFPFQTTIVKENDWLRFT
ncbi:hypothetical protein J3L18_23125 [Mucilaginibacter gossypii]|uniref:hypothetical protein n=1 Tax=Mucilaginibacter gossypii TaxID=551996 RepID=UPI000DCD9715|nr:MULTISPECIES: hypothetical protein [Mucilaginibacter]QTE36008.1 hypothetical protein J3L18_23125 [Mucilaginibacter gossypii]RAV56682.1 hypothetical protein DIU36_14875 [Mucilaginibacter rubeus]